MACAFLGVMMKAVDEVMDVGPPSCCRATLLLPALQALEVAAFLAAASAAPLMYLASGPVAAGMLFGDYIVLPLVRWAIHSSWIPAWVTRHVTPPDARNLDSPFLVLFATLVVAAWAWALAAEGLWPRALSQVRAESGDNALLLVTMCVVGLIGVGALDVLAFNEEISVKKTLARAVALAGALGLLLLDPVPSYLRPLLWGFIGYVGAWFVFKRLQSCNDLYYTGGLPSDPGT